MTFKYILVYIFFPFLNKNLNNDTLYFPEFSALLKSTGLLWSGPVIAMSLSVAPRLSLYKSLIDGVLNVCWISNC